MNETPLPPQSPDPSEQNPAQDPALQQPQDPAVQAPQVPQPQPPQFQAPQQPVAPQQPEFQTPQQPIQPQQPTAPGYVAPQQTGALPYQAAAPQSPAPYGAPQDPSQPQFAAPGVPGAPSGPGTSGEPKKKGLSTGALIGIIAGALALVLLIVGGIFAARALLGSVGTTTEETESGSTAKTADAAVEEYLNALAEGDATTARKIVGGSTNNPLLTDEVLAQSIELAPLTDIVVEEAVGEDYTSTVSASFKLGDQTISRDFSVYNYGSSWEISDAVNRLSVSQFDGLELTINGVSVTDDYPEAFIGTYKFELGIDEFELSGESDVFIVGSDDDAQALYDVKPQLTEEATAEYRELVRASLNKCLESKGLETECGLSVSGEVEGLTVNDGTVTRTLTPEGDAALNKLAPTSNYDDPSTVSTYDYIRIDISAAFSDGSTGTLYGGNTGLLEPNVDFSEDEPSVSWR